MIRLNLFSVDEFTYYYLIALITTPVIAFILAPPMFSPYTGLFGSFCQAVTCQ